MEDFLTFLKETLKIIACIALVTCTFKLTNIILKL